MLSIATPSGMLCKARYLRALHDSKLDVALVNKYHLQLKFNEKGISNTNLIVPMVGKIGGSI